MKHGRFNLIILVLLLFVTSLFAGPNKATRATIEQNYIEGINSDNLGLKVSSAYFLGEMQSQKAVIPLMAILRGDKSDGARLAAALALVKIGDARGVYMVKRTIDFNDREKVRKLAKHLYSAYLHGDTEMLAQSDVSYVYLALN